MSIIDEVGTPGEIIRAHLAQTGQSMRGLSLEAGLGPDAVHNILHRPGQRATRRTLDRLGAVLGVALPEPVVCPITWSEAARLVDGMTKTAGRRDVLRSRVRSYLRLAGIVAETAEVDRAAVIRFFDGATPVELGLSQGSFETYKCDVLAVADHALSSRPARRRSAKDLGGVHGDLYRAIVEEGLPSRFQYAAGPILIYLEERDLPPAALTADVLADYLPHRRESGVKGEERVRDHVRAVASLWTRLSERPAFARFALRPVAHPLENRRDRYRVDEALLAPLLGAFDGEIAPWAQGDRSATGEDHAAFLARLDAMAPEPTGKKALLRKKHGAENNASGPTASVDKAAEPSRRDVLLAEAGFCVDGRTWGTKTLDSRRHMVIALAKALYKETGFLIETIDELTDPDVVEAAAAALSRANAGPHSSSYVESVLQLVLKIARGFVGRPAGEIAQLDRLRKGYRTGKGIAPRNRAKLAHLTPKRERLFKGLSGRILKDVDAEVRLRRAERKRLAAGAAGDMEAVGPADARGPGDRDRVPGPFPLWTRVMARQVMCAVAHDLMMARAPRSANVLGLRLDWIRWRERIAVIEVPATEVKGWRPTDPPLVIELGPAESALLRRFVETVRPHALGPGDARNPYLFPSQARGSAARPGEPYKGLLKQLCREVHRRAGFRLHPHLYRHALGWIWLREDPSQLPSVQVLLGHQSIKTTAEYYAQVDQEHALHHWRAYLDEEDKAAKDAKGRTHDG